MYGVGVLVMYKCEVEDSRCYKSHAHHTKHIQVSNKSMKVTSQMRTSQVTYKIENSNRLSHA